MIEPGSEVRTDGWGGYNALPQRGYFRNRIVLSLVRGSGNARGTPRSRPPQTMVAGYPARCGARRVKWIAHSLNYGPSLDGKVLVGGAT